MKHIMIALAVLCLSQCGSLGATTYTVSQITGWAGSTSCSVYDINSNGQIVGNVLDRTGDHACLWDSTGPHDLMDLGGRLPFSEAYAINDSGLIAGMWVNGGNYAVQDEAGSLTELPGFKEGSGKQTRARAVNNNGVIVGDSFSSDNATHACLWDSNGIHDLGVLAKIYSGSTATGINDGEVVVGATWVTSGYQHAFCWKNGAMTDLTPGLDSYSYAWGINNSNQIVGVNGAYACMWDDKGAHTLMGLANQATEAYGINASGVVVGDAFYDSSRSWAYLWDSHGMHDLNQLIDDNRWRLLQATAINDRGQIIGTGSFNGKDAWFLLTPTVPEPSAFLALFAGLGSIGGLITRKKR